MCAWNVRVAEHRCRQNHSEIIHSELTGSLTSCSASAGCLIHQTCSERCPSAKAVSNNEAASERQLVQGRQNVLRDELPV